MRPTAGETKLPFQKTIGLWSNFEANLRHWTLTFGQHEALFNVNPRCVYDQDTCPPLPSLSPDITLIEHSLDCLEYGVSGGAVQNSLTTFRQKWLLKNGNQIHRTFSKDLQDL